MIKVSDLVKGDKKATFQYYRQGNLMYQTDDGFLFPVPVSETNDATFPKETKAITLMRWIRKHVEHVNLVDPPGGGTPNDD